MNPHLSSSVLLENKAVTRKLQPSRQNPLSRTNIRWRIPPPPPFVRSLSKYSRSFSRHGRISARPEKRQCALALTSINSGSSVKTRIAVPPWWSSPDVTYHRTTLKNVTFSNDTSPLLRHYNIISCILLRNTCLFKTQRNESSKRLILK
jgi:hypothetical protein